MLLNMSCHMRGHRSPFHCRLLAAWDFCQQNLILFSCLFREYCSCDVGQTAGIKQSQSVVGEVQMSVLGFGVS